MNINSGSGSGLFQDGEREFPQFNRSEPMARVRVYINTKGKCTFDFMVSSDTEQDDIDAAIAQAQYALTQLRQTFDT